MLDCLYAKCEFRGLWFPSILNLQCVLSLLCSIDAWMLPWWLLLKYLLQNFGAFIVCLQKKNDRLIIRIVYKNENETIVLFFLLCFYWLILPFAFKGTPCITDCVMAELEKLGQKYRVALRYFPMFFSYFNFIDEKSSSFAVELYVFSVSIC